MTTFAKLNNGRWGIKTDQQLKSYQVVEVTTKTGGTKTVMAANQVWSKDGVSLWSFGEMPKPSKAPAEIHDGRPTYPRIRPSRSYLTHPGPRAAHRKDPTMLYFIISLIGLMALAGAALGAHDLLIVVGQMIFGTRD